jgi:TolB protein
MANALKIEVTKGEVKPDPIAVVDFYEQDGGDSEIGTEICDIIRDDLDLSGLFVPIDKGIFIESKKTLAKIGPNINNWEILNARFLVHGSLYSSFGSIVVKFELIDVVTGQKMLLKEVTGSVKELRKLAHNIADELYYRITNEVGYFSTKIVYVETSYDTDSSKRRTRLVEIDQDGFGPKELTDGSSLVVTPRYSNDGRKIAYISYHGHGRGEADKFPRIYVRDTGSTSSREMISKSLMENLTKKNHNKPVRMTYSPHFAPNNESAVLAIIIDGKSAIYTINFGDNKLTQLTPHEGINTSPCFSPDGKQIVFTSNRFGKEAIFVMDSDGGNQRKISLGDGKYSQPAWSPRGDLISFSKQQKGRFFIGTMKPDGSCERLIVSGYLVEAPCWSSNGRYLAYSTQARPGAKNGIAVVDITGHHVRLVRTRKDASYPAWSP